MKIIAHRAGAKIAPENSLEAIKICKSLGLDAAEIDVRITKDNKLVVFHDRTLKRLAGIDKEIKDLDLTELKKIKLKNGAYIPELAEAIEAAGNLQLVIEGKSSGWAELLARELQNYRASRHCVISFNSSELVKFHELYSAIDCYLLKTFNGYGAVKLAEQHDLKGIDISPLALNPVVYLMAKRSNLKIILFTINSSAVASMYSFFYPGVRISTDRPDKFIRQVKKINN